MFLKKHLKKFFIPHKGNNYHPHILHTKRAIFYGIIFLVMKFIVFVFVVLLPFETFTMPDMLKSFADKIIKQTNEIRNKQGIASLSGEVKLFSSANSKSWDMVQNNYFEHTSPAGKHLKDFLQEADYNYRVAGENLAVGFYNVDQLIKAWVNSPTHYDNLVDKDFQDIGIGMAVGTFKGTENIIFVTEHFGVQKKVEAIPEVAGITSEVADIPEVQNSVLLPIIYDREKSEVFWQENPDSTITLTTRAYVTGSISKVTVEANQYDLELFPTDQTGLYIGKIQFVGNSDDLFRTIVNPTIKITDEKGQVTNDSISWYNPKILSVSSIEKYNQSKDGLSRMFSIFNVSRGIYLFFIVFFTVALALKIFIEFKIQHPHIIFQTLLLISLLVVLFEV